MVFPIACDCLSKRKINHIIVIRRYILLKMKHVNHNSRNYWRLQKKQHYQELLTRYKDNMKKSWGIIKNTINKNKSLVYQTKFKLRDGTVTTDKTAISKYFNEFFLNVGPNLAKAIPKINIDPKSYLGESMKETIFWNLLLWMRSKRLYWH